MKTYITYRVKDTNGNEVYVSYRGRGSKTLGRQTEPLRKAIQDLEWSEAGAHYRAVPSGEVVKTQRSALNFIKNFLTSIY